MQNTAISILLLIFSVAAFGQYKNVQVMQGGNGGYPPCEPSIAIDPNDPSNMVGGAVLNYVFSSSDSGQTWKSRKLRSRYGVYGDPCVIADDKGRFYYFHLSDPTGRGWAHPGILDRIVVQRRSKFLKRWSRGASIGLNHPKDQDKEWAVFDPLNQAMYVTWTEFDTYGSEDPNCRSRIRFAYSTDYAKTWHSPDLGVNVPTGNCLDKSATAEGAVPAVGPDGKVYTSWGLNGHIYFYKFPSLEELTSGNTFTSDSARPILDSAFWAFDVPGIGRANGFPVTKCDRSGGENHGTLYINWADQRRGKDDTDIWLSKSTDGGNTWSAPKRVNNDPPGKHQFFTWMDIDQSTGYIYIVFYDRRNYDDEQTDVYLAISHDGGETFENVRISESPFRPSPNVFFGDYNNISAINGVIRPIWTRNDEGRLSIWTALVDF